MSNDSSAPKPFEWLSGGLFFGGGKKGGIESVDSCKDVSSLLHGIDENLTGTLAEGMTEEAASSDDKEPSQSIFLASRLSRLRFLLYDERRLTSGQDYRRGNPAVAGVSAQALAGSKLSHLVPELIENLHLLPFESRKHATAIFNYLLVCGLDGNDRDLYTPPMNTFRDYVQQNFDVILAPIVRGHDCSAGTASDVGLHCGSMYRSCFRHVNLYRELVATTARVQQYVLPFLDKYAHVPNFDISSDAMESLKLIFTAGTADNAQSQPGDAESQQMSELAASFLTRDYDLVWVERFNPKLLSDSANYMTKRVALQILSTVLLTRSNYAVMIQYVNSRKNLILVMHLLRDTSPHISLDAFHVFKVFVANPNKIPEVTKILKDNSVKLCAYLETLHHDKESSDTQFRDEKALIVSTISGL